MCECTRSTPAAAAAISQVDAQGLQRGVGVGRAGSAAECTRRQPRGSPKQWTSTSIRRRRSGTSSVDVDPGASVDVRRELPGQCSAIRRTLPSATALAR